MDINKIKEAIEESPWFEKELKTLLYIHDGHCDQEARRKASGIAEEIRWKNLHRLKDGSYRSYLYPLEKMIEANDVQSYWCMYFKSPESSKHALKKLLQVQRLVSFRDHLRNGWKPDWGDDTRKYAVVYHGKRFQINYYTTFYQLFAFQDRETAKEFLRMLEDDLYRFFKEFN